MHSFFFFCSLVCFAFILVAAVYDDIKLHSKMAQESFFGLENQKTELPSFFADAGDGGGLLEGALEGMSTRTQLSDLTRVCADEITYDEPGVLGGELEDEDTLEGSNHFPTANQYTGGDDDFFFDYENETNMVSYKALCKFEVHSYFVFIYVYSLHM